MGRHRATIGGILSRLVVCDPSGFLTGCWEWPGCCWDGYGVAGWGGRTRKVHRLVYEHFRGSIPAGKVLDHLCRNRKCANPDHLEAVSIGVNTLRGITLSAANRDKRSCPRCGSSYSVLPSGARRCRPCHSAHGKRYRAEKLEAAQ